MKAQMESEVAGKQQEQQKEGEKATEQVEAQVLFVSFAYHQN